MTKNSTFSIISPSKGPPADDEDNFPAVTVLSSVVSNGQILNELNLIFCRILNGRKIKMEDSTDQTNENFSEMFLLFPWSISREFFRIKICP